MDQEQIDREKSETSKFTESMERVGFNSAETHDMAMRRHSKALVEAAEMIKSGLESVAFAIQALAKKGN